MSLETVNRKNKKIWRGTCLSFDYIGSGSSEKRIPFLLNKNMYQLCFGSGCLKRKYRFYNGAGSL